MRAGAAHPASAPGAQRSQLHPVPGRAGWRGAAGRRAVRAGGGAAGRRPEACLVARQLRGAAAPAGRHAGLNGRRDQAESGMLTARPGILDIAPYVGGDAKLPGQTRVIRLASNESALGASPRAVEAYRALAPELHRYPDGAAAELRAAHRPRRYGLDAGADRLRRRLRRADLAADPRLCRAGRRGALQPARLPDVSDRRQDGRRHAGRGAGAGPAAPTSTRCWRR